MKMNLNDLISIMIKNLKEKFLKNLKFKDQRINL